MTSAITITPVDNVDTLMPWRMEVLRCVFSLSADADLSELERANRRYYEEHLPDGSHMACLAFNDGEEVGCGGVCFYEETPSPDNPNGRCAYLMNIYVRPGYRGRGVARRIVRWLVGLALERESSKIYLETSNDTRKLYAGLGFRYMKDMMKIEII